MYFKEYALPLFFFGTAMSLKLCAIALLCSLNVDAQKNEHPHTHHESVLKIVVHRKQKLDFK